jgi:phosphoglycolate phosphatase-like HAD superfamily hydrolase
MRSYMRKNIKAVVFAVDGTLVHTKEFIIQDIEYALAKYNHPYHIGETFMLQRRDAHVQSKKFGARAHVVSYAEENPSSANAASD